jgi:predicted transcriptional regulator YheO
MSYANNSAGFGAAIAESVSAAIGESFEIVLYDMKDPDHAVL